ncbi:hypothetical protein [Flavobacterium sp.]|uniref:hypothetical protein n=1 Tax=Flavobacterium sp. TaxID=239 RepID=UPI00261385DF|nr:hypothetical protein [Flavobacterium sp.]
MEAKFDIDAIILWVDGDDENHRIKISKYLEDDSVVNLIGFKTRYNQSNEIKYCVDSIIKFAPYIKNIYIITDNQIPPFYKEADLEKYNKVKIIDHTVIFKGYEDYLPVFNSNAIETMAVKIPNLSENYICFNDDMILIKPTKPSDFFDSNGVPIIRGKFMSFESDKLHKKLALKLGLKKPRKREYLGYTRKQDFFFKLMNQSKKICINHTPFTFRKSTMENFYKLNPEIFLNNISFKFRSGKNALTQSISAFEEVQKNNATLKNDYQLIQIDSPKKNIFWIKLRLFLGKINSNKIFLNIQSLDLYSDAKVDYIKKWLDKLYI